jgi:hypothetical protein
MTVEHRSHLIEETRCDDSWAVVMRATMITADPRPMSSAPLDGTPVRLFATLGSAIASFWTAERSRKAFGAGDYRAGWFLLDDEAVELNNPMGWEPLTHEIDR